MRGRSRADVFLTNGFLLQKAPSSQDADALVATSGVIDLSAFTGAFMLEDDTSQSVEEGTDEVKWN